MGAKMVMLRLVQDRLLIAIAVDTDSELLGQSLEPDQALDQLLVFLLLLLVLGALVEQPDVAFATRLRGQVVRGGTALDYADVGGVPLPRLRDLRRVLRDSPVC